VRRIRAYGWILTRRYPPNRIWQAILAALLLAGIYGFLSGLETAIARQWVRHLLARLR
jgi:hypothetical protein